MSSTFGAGFGILFVLPVLIGQWIGVIGLAKCGRSGAWWCMLAGTVLSSLGALVTVGGMVGLMANLSRGSSGSMEFFSLLLMAVAAASGLGSLLFVIGFAIHGLKARRMQERMEELESVLAAQSEQLGRQGANVAS